MSRLTILFGLLISFGIQAQYPQLLSQAFEPVDNSQSYTYYRTSEKVGDQQYAVEVFYLSGNIKMRGTYSDAGLSTEHGFFQFFYPDGKLESEGQFVRGRKSGVWKRFESNGNPKKDRYYPEQVMQVSTQNHEPAQFPGGYEAMIDFIDTYAIYPEHALFKDIEGTVKVAFNIDQEGQLKDVSILQSAHYFLDKEVIELINKMPLWTPAHRNESPVASTYILPLHFVIQDGQPTIVVGVGFH
ncbi:MAG: TonB family protein [Flavobacteriales bacterium]|nr:TonB family protein [Flavobacteriales bacterium]